MSAVRYFTKFGSQGFPLVVLRTHNLNAIILMSLRVLNVSMTTVVVWHQDTQCKSASPPDCPADSVFRVV